MKYLLIILMACLVIGCQSENPLCTDSFCLEGEIYPRSELSDGQTYDEWNVDESGLLGVLGGAEPITQQSVDTLAKIVADVESGGTAYLNQSITTTVIIQTDNADFEGKGYVTIIVPSYTTSFYIVDTVNPANMDRFKQGWLYTLTLNVYRIRYNEEYDDYTILSTIKTSESITEAQPTTINTNLDDIVSDVKSGSFNHYGKVVNINAIVVWTSEEGDTVVVSQDGNQDDGVNFFITSHDTPDALSGYERGDANAFTVFIYQINKPDGVLYKNYTVYAEVIILPE